MRQNLIPLPDDLVDRLADHLSRTEHLRQGTFAKGVDPKIAAFTTDFTEIASPERAAALIALYDAETWHWGSLKEPITRCAAVTTIEERDDLRLLLAVATRPRDDGAVADQIAWILPLLERMAADPPPWFSEVVEGTIRGLDRRVALESDDYLRRRAQLVELLDGPPSLDLVVRADDDWAVAVRRLLSERPVQDRAPAVALIAHLETCPSGPRPSDEWRTATREVVAGADRDGELLHTLLAAAPGVGFVQLHQNIGGEVVVFDRVYRQSSQHQIKGALWAALDLGATWAPDLICAIAETACRKVRGGVAAPKVANTAIAALGELAPADAVAHLLRVQGAVKHKAVRNQIDKALTHAGEAAGLSASTLVERSIPTLGLDEDGRMVQHLSGHEATVAIHHDGTVNLTFTDSVGAVRRTAPAELKAGHADELASLKSQVKELKAALASERDRLEGLLAEDLAWSGAEWRRWYIDHPVTGTHARRLIWSLDVGGERSAVLPALDGATIPDDATIRLWHPVDDTPEEVARWRARLLEAELRQPFKQAYRESYLLAPAEVVTERFSNRFAAHVLVAGQLSAIARGRRWSVSPLVVFDTPDPTLTRTLPGDLRAEWSVGVVADGGHHPVTGMAHLVVSGEVRMLPADARSTSDAVLLRDLPVRLLSEVFRDLDLFVSVTSIAIDPTWADRGDDRTRQYWATEAFGALNPGAQARREVLGALLPRLTIADRCALEDRYLVVRGDRRTYRIHLGSGNVKMTPNDEYLCIVPERGPKLPARVFLPFDDDRTLSVILSKAFLLADDTNITDPTILAQIARA